VRACHNCMVHPACFVPLTHVLYHFCSAIHPSGNAGARNLPPQRCQLLASLWAACVKGALEGGHIRTSSGSQREPLESAAGLVMTTCASLVMTRGG
jgi:hypothetical protein